MLSAVVLKFSKARGRYERQGLLVEEKALDKAEAECLADAEARARRADRQRERSAELDRNYVEEFPKRVRELFPGCPAKREVQIAEQAAQARLICGLGRWACPPSQPANYRTTLWVFT